MDTKAIAKLAEISYISNTLNEKRVNNITKHLTKAELRAYLKALKRLEKKNNILFEYAYDLSEQNKKKFKELYGDKQITFIKNPDLLVGIRITEDDKVYNLNMNHALEQVNIFISKSL